MLTSFEFNLGQHELMMRIVQGGSNKTELLAFIKPIYTEMEEIFFIKFSW